MKTVPLGEVAQIESGGTPSRKEATYFGGDIPWVKSGELSQKRVCSTEETITDAGLQHSAAKWVQPDAVLVAMYGATAGQVAILGIPATTNQAIASVSARCSATLSYEYLYRYLSSQLVELKASARGGAQPNLNLAQLKRLPIPMPPLEEQRRIAAVLDAADDLRTKRRQALAKLDTLTQAIFIDMFGDPAKSPSLRPLGDLVDSPITRGIDQPGEHLPGGIPYIKTTDFRSDRIVRSQLACASPDIAAKSPRSIVDAGDIVMCIRATVGPVMLVTDELAGVNLSRGTARIAPSDQVLSDYLLAAMSTTHFKHQIGLQLRGATFLQIPLGEVRKLSVPVAPIREQRRFVSILRALYSTLHSSGNSLAELDTLFASLQQRAFAGDL